jgi:6-pyruvoyltetrahydropterin/6-carboxytetrahydropterin synthase
MMLLTSAFEFSAAHRLHNPELSEEENERIFGHCSRPSGHGHNYRLEVTVAGEPEAATGFALNLSDLKRLVEAEAVDLIDHRNLNVDIPFFAESIPTAENISIWLWDLIAAALGEQYPKVRLYRIRLWETANNSVEYLGPDV